MTELTISAKAQAHLTKRNAAEKRFRLYGLIAIGLALSFLVLLFGKENIHLLI